MYFQSFDDKRQCYGYYLDGTISRERPSSEYNRTWSYALSLGDRPLECADLYCARPIDTVCPDDLRSDWKAVTDRLKAFLRSFNISKVDLNENCFYDLVPERFLLEFYDIKNEITKSVFEDYERPQNYDFLYNLSRILKEIKQRKINFDLQQLRRDAHSIKARNLVKKVAAGRLYCDYNIFGTKTGRLACNPNTFPILNLGKEFRRYIKPKNQCFVELDFNAFELRVLLYLLDKDQPDIDLHQWNIENVYRGLLSRDEAKKRIFSWLYNLESNDYLSERSYNREQVLERYWNGTQVVNPFGRVIESDKYHAISYLVQSTAADIVLRQMIKLHRLLQNKKSHIAFTVHDSVVIDLAREDSHLLQELKEQFSTFLNSKFLANISIGADFGDMEAVSWIS